MSLGSNGVDRARSLQKILKQLCGTNFCINRLHWVSCSDKTVPNAPKHYKMHENLSFGSSGADNLRSLRKIPTRLCGTNFCINCTCSAPFAPSFGQERNSPKYTQTVENAQTHEFRVQWCGSGAFIAKKSDATSWQEPSHNCSRSARFASSFVQ